MIDKKNLFYFILGLLIIFYTIYRRMFFIRLPKYLDILLFDDINYRLIFVIFVSIIIFSYLLYKNIYIHYYKLNVESWASKLLLKFLSIIDNAVIEVYKFFFSLFEDPYYYISFLAQNFYKHFKNFSEVLFLFILYAIRIIILICFLIDVFIYFRFDYMYKSIFLLGLSMFIKILFFILKDFASNLDTIQSVLIINSLGVNNETNVPRTEYSLKEEFSHLDLKYYVGQFILCSKIEGYLHNYNLYKTFFDYYFNNIVYLVYLIGWLFIFIKNVYIYIL